MTGLWDALTWRRNSGNWGIFNDVIEETSIGMQTESGQSPNGIQRGRNPGGRVTDITGAKSDGGAAAGGGGHFGKAGGNLTFHSN